MSSSSEEMKDKAQTYRRYEDGDHVVRNWQAQIFNEDCSHKCPTYVHRTPPCQGSCPSGEDVRGWLQIVRGIEKPAGDMSMQEYAFQRSTEANPFPSMMGRVCPAPCQQGCNRNNLDDFVGINAVEQYIGDQAFEKKFAFTNLPDLTGKRVAIVGGGPAGMAAAFQLRKKGHYSTIFDDHAELGGMMRYGIPGYRTPRDVLDHECQRILDMGGIEFRNKCRIGRDVSVAELEKDYDAILWALGCKSGRMLPLPNSDAPNCISGVDMLEAFNEGRLHFSANKVVCVGGGDTSIDVVSVARRLGKIDDAAPVEEVIGGYQAHDAAQVALRQGADVTLTSLFERQEMTATAEEVEDALKEGVHIRCGVMPVEIVLDDSGRAIALKMAECEMVDNRPVEKEGTRFEIECDLIVSAIGQGGDLTGLEELDNGRGLMDGDNFYRVPGKEGHFVAGDIIRPHLLTTAIGQASVVSETIDSYFKEDKVKKRPKVDVHHFDLLEKLHEAGLDPSEYEHENEGRGTNDMDFAVHNYEDRSKQEVIDSDHLYLAHFKHEERLLRGINGPDSEAVLGHFEERHSGYGDEEAVAEAERCMSCGMCFECDNCVIFCPQDAVYRVKKTDATLGRYVATDYDKCIGCHICADVCPTGYIDMGMGDH